MGMVPSSKDDLDAFIAQSKDGLRDDKVKLYKGNIIIVERKRQNLALFAGDPFD